jgi:hypothetical protein
VLYLRISATSTGSPLYDDAVRSLKASFSLLTTYYFYLYCLVMGRLILARTSAIAQTIRNALPNQPRTMATSIPKAFDINSKYKLNSGHEIPILGYGVYQT